MRGARLYQQVAEKLAAAIGAGDYPAGTRLPAERKLAERFEVSRPTVREAIIALELGGYVEVKGGSGVYVTDAQPSGFSGGDNDIGAFEVLQARMMFEGEAAGLAAREMSDSEITQLEVLLEEMVAENAAESGAEIVDEKFHLHIARCTHNDAVVSVCEHLWKLRNSSSISVRILERARQAGSKPRIEEHRRILQAIKARDPEAARNAMRDHLQRVVQQLLDATEAEALEQARREMSAARQRFALP
ncbi:FadR/GntR family transcriptional regulator [Microbulbifer agarilyticus]|uniref:FadR/GntR family transcriptional regulator n=1 Tax=Microbulbifer agarilyticus TaxID=260552 RepID=UPI001C97DD7F|nr:FadR/GntR family transcriptional regulator [Microbulbifer agarilyticus]MBY6190052.1 FadR family transcriptional regulator [Microbulbifer agarilyticus]MBY6210054.1 FadR family transcriptional regulator [Microbulbifer agarilyticus]MCA0892544.1 FadR family transcriptional regulator [Microbulbifer agarilyticus]